MDYLYWALALLALILVLYYIGIRPYNYFADRAIPFLKPVPYFGNLGSVIMRKKNFADHVLHIYNSYKDTSSVIGFYEFMNPVMIVCDPEAIRMIAVKDADYFVDHRTQISEDVDPLIGKGLVSLQGQRWKHMRSTLSPAFTSSKMKAMFLLVAKCGDQMADYLAKRCEGEENSVLSLEMKDFFTRYTNDVIATTAFGIHVDSLEDQTNEFYMMGKEAVNVDWKRMLTFAGFTFSPRLMKYLNATLLPAKINKFFRSLVHDTISVREKEHIVRPDMIHLLMQAKKGTLHHDDIEDDQQGEVKSKSEASELSDDDITAQALLFFLAGFDTSSTLLVFVSHLLALNPEVQDKLQQEIDAVIAEDGGEFTYDGMQRMKCLDMTISETLRLFPPAPLTDRKCIKPYVLEATDKTPSIKLEEGDAVWIPIYAIHRDPQHYEDPDKFDPERFSDENKHNIKPYTYLPFGTGPRNCIGMRFALMEAKVAVVCILRRFNFEVVAKTGVPLVLDNKSFTMTAKGGSWVGIKPRETTTAL